MSEMNRPYDPNVYPGTLLDAVLSITSRDKADLQTLPTDFDVSLEYVITNGLTEREAKIVKMRHQQGMTFESIGKVFGVTRERVRQIEHKALRKLRHPSRWRYIQYGITGVVDSIKESAFQDGYRKGFQFGYEQAIINSKLNKVNYGECGDLTLADLDLSVRSYNCLTIAGVKYAMDIVDMGYHKLIHVRNFGRKSFYEVIEQLKKYGYDVSNLLPPKDEV